MATVKIVSLNVRGLNNKKMYNFKLFEIRAPYPPMFTRNTYKEKR